LHYLLLKCQKMYHERFYSHSLIGNICKLYTNHTINLLLVVCHNMLGFIISCSALFWVSSTLLFSCCFLHTPATTRPPTHRRTTTPPQTHTRTHTPARTDIIDSRHKC